MRLLQRGSLLLLVLLARGLAIFDSRHRPTNRLCSCERPKKTSVVRMSTVAEIETAIEKFSPQEQRELEAWSEERRALLNASDSLFRLYDDEERAL